MFKWLGIIALRKYNFIDKFEKLKKEKLKISITELDQVLFSWEESLDYYKDHIKMCTKINNFFSPKELNFSPKINKNFTK